MAELEPSGFDEIRHPKKRAFLRALAETGTVMRAAKASGIDRTLVYTPAWRDDVQFQDAMARAKLMAADLLEAEVFRRAVEGVERPTGWHKGVPGGYVREYSDLLLIFALKAVKPEYRDQVEARGAALHVPDMSRLPLAIVARLAAGEDPRLVLSSLLPALVKEGLVEVRPRTALPAAPTASDGSPGAGQPS